MTNVPATKIMMPPPAAIASSLDCAPVPPPPIVHKILIEQNPIVVQKNKSIHSEHGVIHYPFYYGGVASAVSNCCTQPLGVAGVRLQTIDHLGKTTGMTRIFRTIWREDGFPGL
ncbi:hypothetical protein K461DRAFT_277197 [Myriangium duriaei CBS 260.36]|uniref:Uncharacterized protein n=1 Tax=Myriangium duriaei CBS 260.36 TaxID=1168546 RepID=A0A9P4J3Y2_9PEZI|nr:hypothetical protein K461DRAFT_277197 [Myriangium duriaei CBS 260.36]